MQERRLKIVIVGHVDHGKSTLIGRILHDTHSLPDGKIEQVKKACDAEGMDFEFAFLLDALLEEQEQNITIDTTQIHFHTKKRNYIIIDAPGHKEFLKNMITGAAAADAAVLMIDAKEGVQEQSRRHGFLLSLLGIKQVIVAVNKMDLVGFSQEVFNKIREEYTAYLKPLGVTPSRFIPISAKNGLNITAASPELAWYDGLAMVDALDQFTLPSSQAELPLRLVVQDIYRFDERRIIAGRIEAGTLKVGDELIFWPDRKRSRIKSIESWNSKTAPVAATAGSSVAITLDHQIFAERGQIASHVNEGPIEGREFKAAVFWLHASPLAVGRPYTLKLATQSIEVRLEKIVSVMDSQTLAISDHARSEVQENEVAEVIIRSRKPMAFDNGDRITETGRFVLLEGNRIGGGGVIRDAQYPVATAEGVTSENITWTVGEVTPDLRYSHLGHRGAILWLTGLSGSGKSTLATHLEASLLKRGVSSYILDGDNLRHGLNSNLGFSAEDRKENIRRASEVAKIMADAGLVVIVALISPFREDRQKAREICEEEGIPFVEIFINAPLTTCESRDPRDLYKKARKGEIQGFTGIDSPYEAPEKPDLELRTDLVPMEECLGRLIECALDKSKLLTMGQGEELTPGTVI